MIDDLRAITLFVKTIELGSFRECARHFNLSPSVVSQHISQLEHKHTVTLLYRSTRKLTLTSEGQDFYGKAQVMVQSAHHAINTLSQNSESPSGKLTLTMPAGLIKSRLMKKIATFAKEHPQIDLDIRFTDKRIDIINEGIDLALRVGKMTDSSLKSRKIDTLERTLVCSKEYFETQSKPKHADDLKDWDWIKMKMMPPVRNLIDEDGKTHDIPFTPHIEVDNVDAMCEMTRMGLGLSTPPDYLVDDDLKNAELIEVLPDWKVTPFTVYAVWPNTAIRRNLTTLLLAAL